MTTLRDVLTVRVVFPGFSERLACEPIALGLVRLLEFSSLLALAPGDLVTVNEAGVATSVEPAEGWLVEAYFTPATEPEVVDRIAEAWGRSTLVHRPEGSALTVRVFSTSEQWLTDIVESNPLVEMRDVLRRPGQAVVLVDPDDPGETS